jgi:predicted Zn-dependent peptidase
MAVSSADVQQIARKYLDPANLQLVAVGDAAKIKPILEKYGPVEVYNADGVKVGN